jgi:hypothetical protein
MIWDMPKPFTLPNGKRQRGNPNWGKPPAPVPALPTEFEMEVKRLGLGKAEYVASAALKRWCTQNRNRVYVPEWLLTEWEMQVETNFSGAA